MLHTYIDPVCGIELRPDAAVDYSTYKGKTYYFCCLADKEAFDHDPEKYVKAAEKEHGKEPIQG
jgi:YHS domain-containing protein